MKEVTRIATIQVTKIEVVSDEDAEKLIANAKKEEAKMSECLLFNWMADDVTAEIKDFVREVDE